MQHYCSRNLTNTTDLLLFWLFCPTICPLIWKLLQGYWAALEASCHFNLTMEMFSSLGQPAGLLSALKTLHNLNLVYWTFCLKNSVFLAYIEKWLLQKGAVLTVRMVIIVTYSVVFVTTLWRNFFLVSVTGETVFIPSNLFESMDTSSVTGYEPSWYCLQKSEPNM